MLCRKYPLVGRRGDAFRSAEVRPLAADWPLRDGPKRLLHLEARTGYHKLPLGPSLPEESRGHCPFFFLTSLEILC